MKNTISLIILTFCHFQLFSQIPDCSQQYNFSTFVEPYQNLDSTQAISLTEGIVWFSPDLYFPIGFDFDFYGLTTSNLLLTSQYYGAGIIANPDDTKDHVKMMFPCYVPIGDLALVDFPQDSQNGISTISHITEGEVGNRIMKLEWKNVGFLSALEKGYTDSWLNYQLWLYESDQSIEFRIGLSQINPEIEPIVFGDVFSGPSSALVCSFPISWGLVDGQSLIGDPSKPDTTQYSVEDVLELDHMPNSGRVYRWDPNMVSVEENETTTDLNIFPNPMENELNFTSSSVVETIQVVDLTGKLVLESTLQCRSCQVSTKDLSPGLYVVKVKIGDEIISKKINKS